jgi:S-adenosyl methyltransferase
MVEGSTVEGSLPEQAFDTSVPNHARVYDYWLGGKDNYAADREAAERQARAIPQLPWLARQNREFLRRAVRYLAGEAGDLTLVAPGLTDIWAWRPDADTPVTTTEVMRILGGMARKE